MKKINQIINVIIAILLAVSCVFVTETLNTETVYAAAQEIHTNNQKMYIKVEIDDGNMFKILWNEIPDSSGYFVYRSTTKNGEFKKIKTINKSYDVYCYDSNVKDGKLYYYKVVAYKQDGKNKYPILESDIIAKRKTPSKVYLGDVKLTQNGVVSFYVNIWFKPSGVYVYSLDPTSGKTKVIKKIKNKSGIVNVKLKMKDKPEQIILTARPYTEVNGKKYFSPMGYIYSAYKNGDKEIAIKNRKLRTILKDNLDDGKITKNNLANLFSLESKPPYDDLDLSTCTKKDFSFLKYCNRLRNINLSYCEIKDASYITANLPYHNSVEELDLSCNNLKSIDGIERLKKIEVINVESNSISQIEGVEKLKKLKEFRFSDNPVCDFTPIRTMTDGVKIEYYAFLSSIIPWNEMIINARTNCREFIQICKEKGIYDFYIDENTRTAEAEEVMDKFIDSYITEGMSEYDKVRAAHDYIVNTVDYGYSKDSRPGKPLHYDALLLQKGVCADYAYAYQALLGRMGIYCEYVEGSGKYAGTEDHAWNIVRLDDKYYHVDCTWDDPIGGSLRYTYFLISDSTMRSLRNYPWDTSKHPACPSDYV